MSGFDSRPFDSGAFWAQVHQGIPDLQLSDPAASGEAEAGAWQAWHAYLARRREPSWHFDSERFGETMRVHWPKLVEVWIEDSDSLYRGSYVHGEMTVPYVPGEGLDWSANPAGTMNWGGQHYFTFIRWPIRAAMLTGDARYVQIVSDCVRSYLEQIDDIRDVAETVRRGPVEGGKFTVWNSLSIGLKLKALGEALYALRSHPAWSADDCRNTSILIYRLADHLHLRIQARSPVEWQQELNFISSGSGGLGGVGALLPEWASAAEWLETAKQVQEVLLLNQVYPDGFQKEICTQYHKTVIRSFATLQMILARRGLPSFYDTEPFRTRFLAMHRVLTDVLMPDGFTPAINSAVYARDWPAFLAAGNAFFRDPELQYHLERGYRPGMVPIQKGGAGWGNTILNDLSGPSAGRSKPRAVRADSRLLPDSGLAVLRDGGRGKANALVLDFGHPEGGHAYAGQASFTAWVKGKPAVLSPGSPFAYSDPDYRTWYYGTRGQNTVWIGKDDQETWRPGNKRRIWGELLDWRNSRTQTLVRVAHNGYLASKGVRHERTVVLQKRVFFLIHDVLDGSRSTETHQLRWTIRCPDELTVESGRQIRSSGNPGIRLVPAWPDAIEDVEIGWGPSMVPINYRRDMRAQKGETCHVRLVQSLEPGRSARYLVLLVSGDVRDASVEAGLSGEDIAAHVVVDGTSYDVDLGSVETA
jgi:hypothetical protein